MRFVKKWIIIFNEKNLMYKAIKLLLSILLFLCLAKMPFGYFQFVRFAALICFSILAYNANEEGNKIEAIVYVTLAILFQPLIKISLGREIWNIIDVVVGIGLILTVLIPKKIK